MHHESSEPAFCTIPHLEKVAFLCSFRSALNVDCIRIGYMLASPWLRRRCRQPTCCYSIISWPSKMETEGPSAGISVSNQLQGFSCGCVNHDSLDCASGRSKHPEHYTQTYLPSLDEIRDKSVRPHPLRGHVFIGGANMLASYFLQWETVWSKANSRHLPLSTTKFCEASKGCESCYLSKISDPKTARA